MILTRQQIQDDKVIKDIFSCAKEVYGGGIAIPSDKHPCGWDWLDFDSMGSPLNHTFDIHDISNGIYEDSIHEDCNLREVLETVNGKFLFEVNICMDWSE